MTYAVESNSRMKQNPCFQEFTVKWKGQTNDGLQDSMRAPQLGL